METEVVAALVGAVVGAVIASATSLLATRQLQRHGHQLERERAVNESIRSIIRTQPEVIGRLPEVNADALGLVCHELHALDIQLRKLGHNDIADIAWRAGGILLESLEKAQEAAIRGSSPESLSVPDKIIEGVQEAFEVQISWWKRR